MTNPGQVTGYAVALPDDTTRNGEPVWYGGGKLAADLSWPRLAQRWTRPARPDPPLTAAEADALWDYAARTAADATDRIRYCTATGNPAAAADAAYAASDALHVAAAALGSRTLRQAADSYDRAARQPYGRIPAPTPAGNQLRHAARLIAAYAYLTGERSLTPIVLLVRLAALAEAVAELRDSQQRAAQAAAALRAAQHLRTATRPAPPTPGHQAGQPRPPRHPLRNQPGPGPPGRRTRPAQLPRPARHPPVPYQAGPDLATRHRHADRRRHGHAAPPVSNANTYSSPLPDGPLGWGMQVTTRPGSGAAPFPRRDLVSRPARPSTLNQCKVAHASRIVSAPARIVIPVVPPEGAGPMAMSSPGSASGRCSGQADAVLLGALIRDLRLANGWSQGRLVAALEVASGVPLAREYLSRWEHGKRNPGRFWLRHLATVLQVPLTVLEEGGTGGQADVPDRPGGRRGRAGCGIGPDRAWVQRGAAGASLCWGLAGQAGCLRPRLHDGRCGGDTAPAGG